jgi:hypothetical protein
MAVKNTKLVIGRTWDGELVAADERVHVSLLLGDQALIVNIEAPFHDDPPPSGPAGSFDGLWDFEVVEVFLLGAAEHYLELEFGPHGQYLALQLEGRRNVVARGLPLDYASDRQASRWTASAEVPLDSLPAGIHACNAYAIHGLAQERRYLATYPGTGAPDFHQLTSFQPLDW